MTDKNMTVALHWADDVTSHNINSPTTIYARGAISAILRDEPASVENIEPQLSARFPLLRYFTSR